MPPEQPSEMETEKQCPSCGRVLQHRKGKLYHCTNCVYRVFRTAANGEVQEQRVITVRLPASLHAELIHEARTLSLERGEDVSMNRLCVEKLRK